MVGDWPWAPIIDWLLMGMACCCRFAMACRTAWFVMIGVEDIICPENYMQRLTKKFWYKSLFTDNKTSFQLTSDMQCMPIIFITHWSFSVILSSHKGNLSQVWVNLHGVWPTDQCNWHQHMLNVLWMHNIIVHYIWLRNLFFNLMSIGRLFLSILFALLLGLDTCMY